MMKKASILCWKRNQIVDMKKKLPHDSKESWGSFRLSVGRATATIILRVANIITATSGKMFPLPLSSSAIVPCNRPRFQVIRIIIPEIKPRQNRVMRRDLFLKSMKKMNNKIRISMMSISISNCLIVSILRAPFNKLDEDVEKWFRREIIPHIVQWILDILLERDFKEEWK